MPKVLTVDDSRAVRMLVSKNAREMGLEVAEAEDGQQGLAKTKEESFDLIILDVTMPVLDGPGMLQELRAGGNKTPVLMLTSESKRSIVSSLMKMGIEDYILKPFKPDELKAKIAKALKMAGPAPGDEALVKEMASIVQAPSANDPKGPAGGKQFVDILCIDDMENVAKRLRTMIPEHVTLSTATSASAALAICRERVFRIIMVDNDIPDVDSSSLMRQLRVMQPQAAFVMLSLRSMAKAQDEAREAGFVGVIFKPFDQSALEEFLLRYFDNQELIAITDNVISISAFKGRENRLPGYFSQITTLVSKAVEEIAAACFAEVIVDISQIPLLPEKTGRMVLQLSERTRKVGLEIRLVGSAEVSNNLKQLVETSDLPVFKTVEEAKAA
ncbi:MAG TPA: response regulator [Polyangia bacterium]|nr:response regulator [Polyangia bacterium]